MCACVEQSKGLHFCSGFGLSKEHIFSRWTYALVPAAPNSTHSRGRAVSSRTNRHLFDKVDVEDYQGNLNTIRFRVVCKTCNNGWMSRLDNAVKPILTPLILCGPALLDTRAQHLISTWASMKVMVAEHSRPEDVASNREERSGLMDEPRATRTMARMDHEALLLQHRLPQELLHARIRRRRRRHLRARWPATQEYAVSHDACRALAHPRVWHTHWPDLLFSGHFRRKSDDPYPSLRPRRHLATRESVDQAEINKVAHAFNRYSNTMPWRPRP